MGLELQAGFSGLDVLSEAVGLHDQGGGFAGLSEEDVLQGLDEMTPNDLPDA